MGERKNVLMKGEKAPYSKTRNTLEKRGWRKKEGRLEEQEEEEKKRRGGTVEKKEKKKGPLYILLN